MSIQMKNANTNRTEPPTLPPTITAVYEPSVLVLEFVLVDPELEPLISIKRTLE